MAAQQKWYERKFEFAFPVEVYPNICSRLRGAPARLEETARGCSRKVLTTKPEGKWSAQEHAGHLLNLEPLWMARVNDFVSEHPALSVADLSNKQTDAANYNAQPIEDILRAFRGKREELLQRVEWLDAALFSRTLEHPRLKQPMRLIDHLFFVAEHDDHHLARIWQLVRAQP